MLLRVKSSKFFKIIQEDFFTFKYFFNNAISRYRYQKKLKALIQKRTQIMIKANSHSCDKDLK